HGVAEHRNRGSRLAVERAAGAIALRRSARRAAVAALNTGRGRAEPLAAPSGPGSALKTGEDWCRATVRATSRRLSLVVRLTQKVSSTGKGVVLRRRIERALNPLTARHH